MRFHLIDHIAYLGPDRIEAVKCVTLAEEYLADHFPGFPVLPGVLMLEAAAQAAGWVAWTRTDFGHGVNVLRSVRNLRYGHFVAPGFRLGVTVAFEKDVAGGMAFKAEGSVDTPDGPRTAFTGKLELATLDVAAGDPGAAELERDLRANARRRLRELLPRA